MEHLPPGGWADVATKRDLDSLETKLDLKLDAVEARMTGALRREIAALHREVAALHRNLFFGFLTAQAGFAALILGFG